MQSTANPSPLVQPWRFPPAVDSAAELPPVIDPTRFAAVLGDKLAAVTGMAVAVTLDDDAPRAATATGFVRADGMRIALTVPEALVGALVGVRCGGAFVPASSAGAGGASIAAEIVAAVQSAADVAWPGGPGWQAATSNDATPVIALSLSVGGYDFAMPCALAPARCVAAPVDTAGWAHQLRVALEATPFAVRAVLHDRILPLREALAIRVGDVLPIEARRDVSLRVGERALARGTITPEADGHRITITAVGDPGIASANKELP